jgi:hypothetical protein
VSVTAEREKLYVEEWGAGYGSPYLIDADPSADEAAASTLVEDGAELAAHLGADTHPTAPLAFVDGIRRAEAWLYRVGSDGTTARAVVGAFATGAVIADPDRTPVFSHARIKRVAIWGSGANIPLRAMPGGWHWEVASIAATDPDAPLAVLQNRMREAERELAVELARQERIVVLDGPLNFVVSRDTRIAGYVKTHHRLFLPAELHARVPHLGVAERTSLFAIGERYSCYLRIAAPGPQAGPWSGIVRLHLSGEHGLASATQLAGMLTARLPRFAGIPYCDPRAPQNLQPIGALESHLRHLMGDPQLGARAVRDAAVRDSQ